MVKSPALCLMGCAAGTVFTFTARVVVLIV